MMLAKSHTIRLLQDPDKLMLLAIFNKSRASAGCFSVETTGLEVFAPQIEGEEVYLAEADRQAVGFVSVWRPENFIHHLYVLPEYKNRGIGIALINNCIKMYGVPLSLKCAVANSKAQKFYRQNGWVLGDETGIGDDGLWNRLWLKDA